MGLSAVFNPAVFSPIFHITDFGARAPLYAQAGIMRADASRANGTSPQVFVAINGVQYATARATDGQQVDNETLDIQETDGDTPNTASFQVRGFVPQDGQDVVITLGSINNLERQFAGTILTDASGYVGTPANQHDQVTVIDYTWQLTRGTFSRRWANVSATRIATEIIADAGRGFTAKRVEAGLPIVDEFTVTNQTHIAALQALADRIGASVKATYHKDVRFGITPDPTQTDPTTLTEASAQLTEMRDFAVTRDLSQVITRQPVEGGGSNAATPVAVGATTIPVEDIAFYNASGGTVVSGPQRITYTGILSGATTVQGGSSTVAGGSTTVAARPAPTATPAVSVGPTWPSGSHFLIDSFHLRESFIYSDGAESLPSPISTPDRTLGSTDGWSATTLDVGDARVTTRRVYFSLRGWTGSAWVAQARYEDLNDNTSTTWSNVNDATTPHVAGLADGSPLSGAAGYSAGASYLYVSDTSIFAAGGGSARVGSQVFTYTGRSTSSGVGALTGVSGVTASISVGATIEAVVPIGATALPVLDTAAFVATGGSAQVGGQTFTYTGRSTSSGAGNLTGIPSSGTGSLTAVVAGGATVTAVVPAGSTALPVTDTAAFSGTGGSARIGSQTFTYTGRSTSSGAGNLTGIPASGAGSLTSAISGGATVLVGAGGAGTLSGIPASGAGSILYAINQGDAVNLRVVIDDLAAQAAMAALLTTPDHVDDGLIEGALIQDGRISETEARARGRAQIDRRKNLDVAVTFTGHDLNLHASRTQGVNLILPACVGSFRVRSVTIGNFLPARWPTRHAQASSDRFTLEDWLRVARQTGEAP